MKFKFCGGIDCPDWLISEITYLNKINAVKLRIISSAMCTSLSNGGKDYSKITKMLEEINFSHEEISIIIGVLYFIFKSSVKFQVDSVILNQELQQLGLPQENADSMVKVYKSNSKAIEGYLTNDIFKEDSPSTLEWRISYIIADKYNPFTDERIALIKEEEEIRGVSKLDSKVDIKINGFVFSTNKEILGKLINDLDKAVNIIKKEAGK